MRCIYGHAIVGHMSEDCIRQHARAVLRLSWGILNLTYDEAYELCTHISKSERLKVPILRLKNMRWW